MQRKKILWLVSWYPNKNDRFDGDFIQRHARAAAIYHDVHMIFVTDAEIENETEEEWNYATGLTEQIVYFKKKKGIGAKVRKQLTWRRIYQEAIKNYIEKNGLPDVVHVHVPWKVGLIALWMKRKYGTGFIVTEHWGYYNKVVEDNFYTKPKLMQTLLKKIFDGANCFVSVSVFLSEGVGNAIGRKADVILPNVTDTTLFFLKEEKYSKFTFIHVSNMVPLKNVRAILTTFKNFIEIQQSAQLVMVGNRENEDAKYAEHLGLLNKSVFFRGEISNGEVAKEMQRSHCFVLNSIIENSPCVIGEALCCGVPVIATKVGGIPELLNPCNGRLVQPNDNNALLEAMKDIQSNYLLFDQKKIAEDASKKFSYSVIAQKFDELYREFC